MEPKSNSENGRILAAYFFTTTAIALSGITFAPSSGLAATAAEISHDTKAALRSLY
jgi:hypothetical protein